MNERWVDAGGLDDAAEGEAREAVVEGRSLAIYRTEGRVYASDNLCTHGEARLCEGWLEGTEIECPLHQGRFDLNTGKALCDPLTTDIRVYPVHVERDRVLVQMQA